MVTRDSSIFTALRASGSSRSPILMFALGNGGDARIDNSEIRSLRNETFRKPITSIRFLDADGQPTTTPTNNIEVTLDYLAGETTGTFNEIGLLAPANLDPAVKNPIPNAEPYDPSVVVTDKDLLTNYRVLPAPCSAAMSFSFTWALTF